MMLEFTLIKKVKIPKPTFCLYDTMDCYFEEMSDIEGYLNEEVLLPWLKKKGAIVIVNQKEKISQAYEVLRIARETMANLETEGYDTNKISINLLP